MSGASDQSADGASMAEQANEQNEQTTCDQSADEWSKRVSRMSRQVTFVSNASICTILTHSVIIFIIFRVAFDVAGDDDITCGGFYEPKSKVADQNKVGTSGTSGTSTARANFDKNGENKENNENNENNPFAASSNFFYTRKPGNLDQTLPENAFYMPTTYAKKNTQLSPSPGF